MMLLVMVMVLLLLEALFFSVGHDSFVEADTSFDTGLMLGETAVLDFVETSLCWVSAAVAASSSVALTVSVLVAFVLTEGAATSAGGFASADVVAPSVVDSVVLGLGIIQ